MKLRALLLVTGLGLAAIAPAEAKIKTPKSTNANVKRASHKSRKGFKATKYKAPKFKKPKSAKYGTSHLSKHS